MTQIHFPALPHPDFAGTTGAGDIGDAMADMDHNVGLVLEAIKRLGIENNTLVIWCTDNGAEMRRPWRGAAGPWRGYYNSAMEGGIRTPCVIRWPGRIRPGQVSNEVVHEVDLFPTIAAAVGAPEIVPHDRIIDGVNQLPFLEGKQAHSSRDSVMFLAREDQVMAVKWRDWKFWYLFRTEMPDPDPDNLIRLFDLRVDPREETDVKDFYPWVISVMDGIVAEYEASLKATPGSPEASTIRTCRRRRAREAPWRPIRERTEAPSALAPTRFRIPTSREPGPRRFSAPPPPRSGPFLLLRFPRWAAAGAIASPSCTRRIGSTSSGSFSCRGKSNP